MRAGTLLLAVSLLAASPSWAQQPAPVTSPPASAPAAGAQADSQKLARERLMELARFLAGKEKFSVTMRVGYDSVQASGQKIEFGEIREVSLQRPNRVRILERLSDGEGNDMLFDGKLITVFNAASRTFAQAPQPGEIEPTVVYFVRDLQMRLPLAVMLMRSFPDEMQRRVQSVDLVERTSIMGQPAQHIAARTEDVDFQAWIADGKQPLPLRIVMTYKKAPGQPQFWADFSKWNLSPTFSASTFTFKPPAKAIPIGFAVQVRPNLPQPAEDLKKGAKP